MRKLLAFSFALWLSLSFFVQLQAQSDSLFSTAQLQVLEVEKQRIIDSLKEAFLTQRNEEFSIQSKEEDSLLRAELQELISTKKGTAKGVPVVLLEDTLYFVYASLGPYSPEQRARDISQKIYQLYDDESFSLDSINTSEFLNLINVSYGSSTITSISLVDAMWVNMSQDSLASQVAEIIGNKIVYLKNQNSFKNMLVKLSIFALIFVVAFIITILVNIIFKFILKHLENSRKELLEGVKIRNYQILKREQIIFFVTKILGIVQLVVTLILLYAMIPFIFSFFTITQKWSKKFIEWLSEPFTDFGNALIEYLPSLITIVFIVISIRYINKILHFFASEIQKGSLKINGFYPEWAKPTYTIARFLLYVFGLILVFPHLPGSDSLAFKGISVFLGILVSMGSSSAIANAIAGIVITYMRPFVVGDWIKTGEITGVVLEKNALVTRIKTIDNEEVTVPNSSILNSHTINYSTLGKKEGVILTTDVTVGYEVPKSLVEKLLIEAALKSQFVSSTPSPFVNVKSLDPMYCTYLIKIYTSKPEKMNLIHSDLYKNIMDLFTQHNIELSCSELITIQQNEQQ